MLVWYGGCRHAYPFFVRDYQYMLYVVGDSNSVYTSQYFITSQVDARSLCRVGWTTEDVLSAVNKKKSLSDATAFFVFLGLNDRLTGESIASNILQIVSVLRARRSSTRVQIFLAPPFCVDAVVPKSLCDDRRKAAKILVRELSSDAMGTVLVTPHITKDMYAKKTAQAQKPGSSRIDPLHLNSTAYMHIANVVNEHAVHTPHTAKRVSKRKRVFDL